MKIFKLSKYLIALLLLLFVGVYSCKPKERIVQAESELEDKTNSNLFEDILENEVRYSTFSSKLNMSFSTGRKVLNSRATLRIVRNEAIQLSIQPIFGIEMFRLYIQPDCIIILDRMNKRYVQETYDDLNKEYPIGFNFYTLQSLFTNALFIPEQSNVLIDDYRKFRYVQSSNNYRLSGRDRISDIDYSFFVNGNDQITLTQMYMPAKKYSMEWSYDEFSLVEKLFFPLEMKVSASSEKINLNTSISLSSINFDESLTLDSSIPSSYTKVELKEVIKLLADKK
ncbi:MAG TPA: DUF4292 domain-containing protein [Bacteroidales bacterium]|nr:DUF4292 domain-containing protein [Bacteroidales bacterium]